MCIEFIHRHVQRLPLRQIFTTREMLIYGTRSAVDSSMHRLVKSGSIRRLARGVFIRDPKHTPTMMEIVQAKAKAFNKTVKSHIESFLHEVNLIPEKRDEVFARTGHSTSFETVHGRAYIRGVSQKKLHLVDTRVGKAVSALWYLGKWNSDSTEVRLVTRNFRRKEWDALWRHSSLMPAWLTSMLQDWFPLPRLAMDDYFAQHL